MDVTIFLGAGIIAELVLSLTKLRYARRGLVCWTVAAVTLLMCCGVYFVRVGDISVDLPAVLRCAAGAAGLIGTALLLELVSPSRRRSRDLRRGRGRRSTDEPDSREIPPHSKDTGENALNLVLAIGAGILCGAALLLLLCGERDTGAAMLLFPAAAALRQTACFLRLDREDSAAQDSPESRRRRLAERVAGERYRL